MHETRHRNDYDGDDDDVKRKKKKKRIITREEVSRNNTNESNWIIVDDAVYDVTKFAKYHPGGRQFIDRNAGRDCTLAFYKYHRQDVLKTVAEKFVIGCLPEHELERKETRNIVKNAGDLESVPYGESSAFMNTMMTTKTSLYYSESHVRFRKALRMFFDTNVVPECVQLDERGEHPSKELYELLGKNGLLVARMPKGLWMKDLLDNCECELLAGITYDEFDSFHELIAHEETCRLGVPGYVDGLGAGLVIGLPPVLQFGKPEIAKRVGRECLLGKKRICLAISEPGAGSDVAGLQTIATKDPLTGDYIVNGVKKWITNGQFSDYFTTAVKMEDGTFSLLLIDRAFGGVDTKPIKTSYSSSAGTAYVTYENVRVPKEYLLGKEGKGFMYVMHNFNHERWYIVAGTNAANRLILSECFKWSNQRMVFGKKLIEQPVIRAKLATMTAQIEAVQAWMEQITYQMNVLSHEEQSQILAGPIALLKFFCTRVANLVADEACQIFGGRAITRTGMGRVIEAFQKSNKFAAILGGSEEIMADLGIRQAMKFMPNARL
jgi:alkylation response protein AidB-like acyl-CoA dehydrogenase/cytochrome b involved in lipid metabolism